MRTVDATLTAALAAGTGTPYLKAYVGYANGTVKTSHLDMWAYRLTGTTLEFWVPSIANLAGDQEQIWLERGVTINGVNHTLTTGRFWIWEEEYLPNRVTRFKGGIVAQAYYSDAVTMDSYQTVIDAFFTAAGKTTTYKDPAEAWLAYQFMPNPSTISISNAERMLPLLAQKRLLVCCDNGAENVRIACLDVIGASVADVTVVDDFALSTTKQRARQFLWRDELGVYHQDGTVTNPVHNLGFLMSSASAPARHTQSYEFRGYVRPDFRIQDGDTVRALMYSGGSTATFFAKVTEEYSRHGSPFLPTPGHLPAWRMILEASPIFGNAEGGDLPQNVANKVNHAYVNTSMFNNLLTTNESSIQAALEKIDDHHPGGYTREVLGAARTYYVRFEVGTCTISNASPAVVTLNSHGLSNDDPVVFRTTGGLPTGLTAGIVYYVVNKATNTFQVAATVGGAAINTSSAGSGTHYCATGNDANDGKSTGRTRAFLTIQKALTTIGNIDSATYAITVQCADSHYTESPVTTLVVGSGTVTVLGNAGTPGNCIIDGAFSHGAAPTVYTLNGFKMQNVNVSTILAVRASNAARLSILNLDFGTGFNRHIAPTNFGTVILAGAYTISAGANFHYRASQQGAILFDGSFTITLTGTPAFAIAFAYANEAGWIIIYSTSVTYSGAATGTRYTANLNSLLYTNGGGANYFPGSIAGSTATGGVYG
jgi:hypothetical protein